MTSSDDDIFLDVNKERLCSVCSNRKSFATGLSLV